MDLDGSYIPKAGRHSSTPTPIATTPVRSPQTSPALPHADELPPTRPKTRRARIEHAVKVGSVDQLRAIAAEHGGFMNAELRRAAW